MSVATERRYEVTKTDGVDVYHIGSEAVISVQPSTGFVSVTCPWHPEVNGSHYWAHRGGETIYEFIRALNRDYACGKLFGHKQMEEFDLEATQAGLRKWIIESRRDGSMKRDEARDLWSDVDDCETEQDVCSLSIEEPWYYLRHRDKRCFGWFWDTVWASFVAHIREAKP